MKMPRANQLHSLNSSLNYQDKEKKQQDAEFDFENFGGADYER